MGRRAAGGRVHGVAGRWQRTAEARGGTAVVAVRDGVGQKLGEREWTSDGAGRERRPPIGRAGG